jgi:hypothetical protein
MSTLKTMGLGNFLKSARRSGKQIPEGLDVANSDISSLYSFVSSFAGMFENTYADNTVDPIHNGINAENILVSNDISSGSFYNSTEERPKTVGEILADLRSGIDVSLGSSSVGNELVVIKSAIGSNVFDDGQSSSDVSIDNRLKVLDTKLLQIASDCFNRNRTIGDELDESIYQPIGEGGQTQAKSLRDLIESLLEIHGGLTSLDHSSIARETIWAINFGTETIAGGQTRYSAPFGQGYQTIGTAQRFYNPMSSPLKISKLYTYIDQNTLVDNITITVYKNGTPTEMLLHVAGSRTGSAFNIENEITVEPNSYIQFRIDTGIVESGTAHINNISLILKEIN